MTSRNSFLDSPSFRRITTPTQRRSVESRRRSSGFRGGGSSSSPIRRETPAEREQRIRQERLKSFQSELSDTGTRLTASERQAILEGESVDDIRKQVVDRQRRQGFASLQRDLSRSGTRLTDEEARLIAEGEASPSSVRERISQRRGRTFAQQEQQSFVTRGDERIPVSEGFAGKVEEEIESGRLQSAQEQLSQRERRVDTSVTDRFLAQARRNTDDRSIAQRLFAGMSGDLTVRNTAMTPYPGAPDFDTVEVVGLASNFVGGWVAGSLARRGINFVGRRSPAAGLLLQQGGTGLGVGYGGAAVVDTAIRNPERIPGLALTTALQGAGFARGFRGAGISVERVGRTRTTSGFQSVDDNVLRAGFTQETPVRFNVFGRPVTTNRVSNVNVIGTRSDPGADFRVRIGSVTADTVPFGTGSSQRFTRFSDSSLRGFADSSTGSVLASNRRELFASVPVAERAVFRDSGLTGSQVVSETLSVSRGLSPNRFRRGVSNEFVTSESVNIPRVDVLQSENLGFFRVVDRPRTVSSVTGVSRSGVVPRRSVVSRGEMDLGSNLFANRVLADPTGGLASGLVALRRPVRVSVPTPSTRLGGVRGLSGFVPRVRGVRSASGFLAGFGFGSSVSGAVASRQSQRVSSEQFPSIGVLTEQFRVPDIGTDTGVRGLQSSAPRTGTTQRTSLFPRVRTSQLGAGLSLPRPAPPTRTPPVVPRIPLPELNFGRSPRRRGRSRSGQREEFTPSIVANFFGIKGRRPSVSTGIEIRPIIG